MAQISDDKLDEKFIKLCEDLKLIRKQFNSYTLEKIPPSSALATSMVYNYIRNDIQSFTKPEHHDILRKLLPFNDDTYECSSYDISLFSKHIPNDYKKYCINSYKILEPKYKLTITDKKNIVLVRRYLYLLIERKRPSWNNSIPHDIDQLFIKTGYGNYIKASDSYNGLQCIEKYTDTIGELIRLLNKK